MSARRACFHIMAPEQDRHRIVATFFVTDEADLLKALQRQLPSLRRDHSLVAVDDLALAMVLKASLRSKR